MTSAALLPREAGTVESTPAARFFAAIGTDLAKPETLPFVPGDVTAGSETELQAAVIGSRAAADLPRAVEQSNYFANVVRRTAAGDTPRRALSRLETWLESNGEVVWEHSWVRFPRRALGAYAASVFENDMRADKSDPTSLPRSDAERFFCADRGKEFLRLPISYLLKLALADALGVEDDPPAAVSAPSVRLLGHFVNDNTSPETHSFHVVSAGAGRSCGESLARETWKRFLFSHLLTAYANRKFELEHHGQWAIVYASPHPPVRLRQLNDCISDAFYRELFMSPCLSGWDNGESKRDYMALCHQTLSRSQINAVAKLREAGIITRNLVVLPNTSNIALANNGTHVSIGSRRLTAALRGGALSAAEEKRTGDLAIKIVEHFLPLFAGTYSAAPYRLDFKDFHPEKALGFLPHQLDYTHLRTIWRRWKGKARISIFGQPVCPLGPEWADRAIAGLFRLRGDLVPDFRLIDYLVAPMSTERSPALDGSLGSGQRLLRDLENMGVFDARMPLYSLYRLRDFESRGFSGFEARYYSLFASAGDFAQAVDLQTLITAAAYAMAASGAVTHREIPDGPAVESERRQIAFGSAIGIPTFYVDEKTSNRFLLRIVRAAQRVRASRRYPGRLRVYHSAYQRALIQVLRLETGHLVEAFGLEPVLADLDRRLDDPAYASAAGKLVRGALEEAGAKSPFHLSAEEFNLASERYYRGALRNEFLEEGLSFLAESPQRLGPPDFAESPGAGEALSALLGGSTADRYLRKVRADLLADRLPMEELRRLIHLMLVAENVESRKEAAQ